MRQLTPFQIEALDYKSNIILTANAGSGKTYVLAKRFIEIILSENVELENIAAITFTDKAAGELNKRIADEIDARLLVEKDKSKKSKLERIRRQLVSANISTIHSFCINILREFAPEAGIDANFIQMDGLTSDELIQLSIDEILRQHISNPEYEGQIKYLIRLLGSKSALVNNLTSAIYNRRIIDQNIKQIYEGKEPQLEESFLKKFDKSFNDYFGDQIDQLIKLIEHVNSFVLTMPKGNETASGIAAQLKKYKRKDPVKVRLDIIKQVRDLLLTGGGTVRKQKYIGNEYDNYENEISQIEFILASIKSFLNLTDFEKSTAELIRFGQSFLSIYKLANDLYLEKKRQKSYLDFEDLLLFAQEVLTMKEVHEYLGKKFKYIMVDEYQDTNELQYNIFMPILSNLEQGNFFAVGDEKQSIYMFRHAELEVFNKTKEDIKTRQSAGKQLNLPHSFRMAPPLVLFTNKLFQSLFQNPNIDLNEVNYDELVCAKTPEENGKVEFLFSEEGSDYSEAQLVAQKIIEITSVNKITDLNEIGILCRKRNQFEELEKEFVAKKIPYSIIGGKGFYQRQVVYDVYNYLSFIVNPKDDTSLFGLLRSPFYTLNDNQLFEISREPGECFFDKLKNYSNQNHELKTVVDQLNAHIALGYSSEIYTLIRKILNDTGYWSVIASSKNSKQELANLEKLLALARNFSSKGFKNIYDFTVSLQESIDTMEDEGQAEIVEDDNSVKLLTIHKAKGLEYKAVFIYGTNRKAQESSVKAGSISIDKNFGILSKVPIDGKYYEGFFTPPTVAMFDYVIKRKNIAEIKRLFYVAVTRATNYLFISADHKNFASEKDSFFQLLVDGLKLNPEMEEYSFSGKVRFMSSADKNYKIYDREVEIKIPVISQTVNLEFAKVKKAENKIDRFLIDRIKDIPKNEIISATKISMFTQCPVKYELTYELGYSTIFNLIKKHESNYEFNTREDDEIKKYASLKGKIIHELLSEDINMDFLPEKVDYHLKMNSHLDLDSRTKLKDSIIADIQYYFCSDVYKELSVFKKFKNELEVYCQEGSHYLYGIIDKLIFEKDRLIVVDYKTDDINEDQITLRAENYFPQLNFYAYILSKLFPEKETFGLRLIFLKHPNIHVSRDVNKDSFVKYKLELNSYINDIMLGNFRHNYNHCSHCQYSIEGNKCIKQK